MGMENEIEEMARIGFEEIFQADDAPAKEELTERDIDRMFEIPECVPGRTYGGQPLTWDRFYQMGE